MASASLRGPCSALPAAARTRRGSGPCRRLPGPGGAIPSTLRLGRPLRPLGSFSCCCIQFLRASLLLRELRELCSTACVGLPRHTPGRAGSRPSPVGDRWGGCVCVSGRWFSPLASRNALAGVWKARKSANSNWPLGLSEPGAADRREPCSPGGGAQHMGGGRLPRPLLPKASVRVPALTTTPTPTSSQRS